VHIIEEAAPPPKWQVPKSQDILLTWIHLLKSFLSCLACEV
jgi:hypothetical protein